jgi:hypothetical protein
VPGGRGSRLKLRNTSDPESRATDTIKVSAWRRPSSASSFWAASTMKLAAESSSF